MSTCSQKFFSHGTPLEGELACPELGSAIVIGCKDVPVGRLYALTNNYGFRTQLVLNLFQ